MKRNISATIVILLFTSILNAQSFTISGYITEAKNSETLISCSVYDSNTRLGTVTNTYGFYSITLPKGEIDLNFSYMGFGTEKRHFYLDKDTIINVSMEESIELKEVTVTANHKEIGIKGSQMSTIDVPVTLIKSVPALFGETDVIKTLQLLPGVQAGVEGSSGIYVRGGGPDENLFMLDGVPIYNVNHMGGFFSVFNADAIKNVTFYKGGFPARFGSRLSSVVDIQMKDGNTKKLHGNISVGIISSKINLEGPVFSKKTSFNISARRTYYDIIAQPFIKMAAATEGVENISAGYYFYDLNAKVTHKLSDNDKLFLSIYSGDDGIYSSFKEGYLDYDLGNIDSEMKLSWKWGNLITAFRWNHIINNKLFMNTTATYTQYRFNMNMGLDFSQKNYDTSTDIYESSELGYRSGINDIAAKVDFDYSPQPNHDIKFGAALVNHTFRPGVSVASEKLVTDSLNEHSDTIIGDKNITAFETALYFEDNWTINNYLKANLGLHYSTFFVQNEFYHSLQPRINLRLLLTDDISLKASYTMMSQYIHLLSNNNISLPTDLWVPVTKKIKPMKANQYSIGAFYNLLSMFDFSVEAYYKAMDNQIEYKDGATFWGSSTGWEDKVAMGRGWSYGVEFMAQKSIGKTQGWIAYTWSKTDRLFDKTEQELNQGKVFPAKYDRRHNLNIVITHKFNDKIDIAGTWIYRTGQNGTLAMQNSYAYPIPDGNNYWYNPEGSIPNLTQRNNFKYPSYQRLDLGINFNKQKKHGIRTWNISVYNVYNRQNPFLIFPYTDYSYNYYTQEITERKTLKQISIFMIMPSISYSYKF
ncbi:MAG: TonB-dependent receptor [Paludibacter sp.]|nr:TonB-dependent receptor [Paludibacter sp.]